MATHGTLDVVVHLHRFRNVDLFYQGLYYAKVKLFTAQRGNYAGAHLAGAAPDEERKEPPATEAQWELVQPYWHFATARQTELLP